MLSPWFGRGRGNGGLCFCLKLTTTVLFHAVKYLLTEFKACVPYEQFADLFCRNPSCLRDGLVIPKFLQSEIGVEFRFVIAEDAETLRDTIVDRIYSVFLEVILEKPWRVTCGAEKIGVVAILDAKPELTLDVSCIISSHVVDDFVFDIAPFPCPYPLIDGLRQRR